MILENWSIVTEYDPYLAPELRKSYLSGSVYGSSRFEDGTYITTSSIKGKSYDGCIMTRSGSRYKLGNVSEDYEKIYPDAYNRLMNSLPLIDTYVE